MGVARGPLEQRDADKVETEDDEVETKQRGEQEHQLEGLVGEVHEVTQTLVQGPQLPQPGQGPGPSLSCCVLQINVAKHCNLSDMQKQGGFQLLYKWRNSYIIQFLKETQNHS